MSCSGYEPFHKTQRSPADPAIAVAEFLIFDDPFPLSIHHCLSECKRSLRAIGTEDGTSEAERKLESLVAWLAGQSIADLIRAGLWESKSPSGT